MRNAFNGGEVSILRRPDIEVYHRACKTLCNFDLRQTGGVVRRRGMRRLESTLSEQSRIFKYQYNNDISFLVELSNGVIRILNNEGVEVWRKSDVYHATNLSQVRARQVNRLLILTSKTDAPHTIQLNDDGAWSVDRFPIVNEPLLTSNYRDYAVEVNQNGSNYLVTFNNNEQDKLYTVGDMIAVETRVPQQTGFAWPSSMWGNYQIVAVITSAHYFAQWSRICVNTGTYWEWWEVVKEFSGARDFVAGKGSPADYPSFFHKGVPAAADPWEFSCKGGWRFQCEGVWYGEYAVERRYQGEDSYSVAGTSFSQVGAGSNVIITGDESDEECLLRLRLYQSKVENSGDPKVGFPSTGNKLIVEEYKKRIWLKVIQSGTVGVVKSIECGHPANYDEIYGQLFPTGVRVSIGPIGVSPAGQIPTPIAGSSGNAVRVGGGTLMVYPSGITVAEATGKYSLFFDWDFAGKSWIHTHGDNNGGYGWSWLYFPNGGYIRMLDVTWPIKDCILEYEVTDMSNGNKRNGEWRTTGHVVNMISSQFLVYKLKIKALIWENGLEDSKVPLASRVEIKAEAGKGKYCQALIRNVVQMSTSGINCSLQSWTSRGVPAYFLSHIWSWSAWRPHNGYPQLCDVLSQRLVFASSTAQPQTIWMSKADDINNFDDSGRDNGAIWATMSTTTQAGICWIMTKGGDMMVGTNDGEWILKGRDGVITPETVNIQNHGFVGSSSSTPALMAVDRCLYVERGDCRLWQYGYSYESDSYVSRDLTVFAEHVLKSGVVASSIQRKPDVRALLVLKDGTIACMTYNELQEVHGWGRIITQGIIEDVVCMANGNKSDNIYLIVNRNGQRSIELIAEDNLFRDGYDHDFEGYEYESELVTTPLVYQETMSKTRPSSEIDMYLGTVNSSADIKITNDGIKWTGLDRSGDVTGWQKMISIGDWSKEVSPGIKVIGSSTEDVEIQAIKG